MGSSFEHLQAAVAQEQPRMIEELSRLIRIKSVGYDGYDSALMRLSAEETASILRSANLQDVRLLELSGGHPAVFGQVTGDASGPTVLLYAHHDVQPAGDTAEWSSPPFEPRVQDGRLFGRGAADNKSAIVMHATALRALKRAGTSPTRTTIKVLVEGEEECSTAHLEELIEGNRNLLRADVAVVADGGNLRTGFPTLCTSLRGFVDCRVHVRVLVKAQHSGAYGGAVPDAIMALSRMISTLLDDVGDVAVEGLARSHWTGSPLEEEETRAEAGVLDSVRLIGSGSLSDRLLTHPAVNVLGVDAPTIRDSANQIVPEAAARISLRLSPSEDPIAANERLTQHLHDAAPWGVEVNVVPGEAGRGYAIDPSGSAVATAKGALSRAFESEVAEVGSGASIPIVAWLAGSFPGIGVLIWGAGDHLSNFHAPDESVDLRDLQRMTLAEADFLATLA